MFNLHITTTNQEHRASTLNELTMNRKKFTEAYDVSVPLDGRHLIEPEYVALVDEVISALYETLEELNIAISLRLTRADLLTYTNDGWIKRSQAGSSEPRDVLGLSYCSLGLATVPHPAEKALFRDHAPTWVVVVAHELVHLLTRLEYHPQDGELCLGYQVRPREADQSFFKDLRHKKLYRVLNEVGTDLTAHAVAERALRKLYSAPDTIPVLLQEVKVKVGYLDPETEASLDLFYRQIEEVSSISAEQVRRRLMRGLFVKNSLASLPINAALGKGAWFLMSYLTSRERFRTGLREIIEHNRTNPEHLEQTILQDHESLVRRFRQIQGRYKKPDFAYHSSRELEEITKPSWNSAILKFTDDQRMILSDYYDHFYGGEEQAFQRGLVDQYIDTPSYYVKRTCVDNCNDVVNGDLDKHVDQLNTLTIPLINSKLEKLYRRSNRCDPAYHEVVQSLVQYTASACYRLENLALLLSFLKGVEIHLDRKEMLSAFETRRILQDLQFGFSLDGRYVPGELRVYSGNSVKRLLSNLNLDDTASKTVGLQKESSFDELYVPALSFLNNPIIYYPGLSRNAARRLSAPASSFLREDL